MKLTKVQAQKVLDAVDNVRELGDVAQSLQDLIDGEDAEDNSQFAADALLDTLSDIEKVRAVAEEVGLL